MGKATKKLPTEKIPWKIPFDSRLSLAPRSSRGAAVAPKNARRRELLCRAWRRRRQRQRLRHPGQRRPPFAITGKVAVAPLVYEGGVVGHRDVYLNAGAALEGSLVNRGLVLVPGDGHGGVPERRAKWLVVLLCMHKAQSQASSSRN